MKCYYLINDYNCSASKFYNKLISLVIDKKNLDYSIVRLHHILERLDNLEIVEITYGDKISFTKPLTSFYFQKLLIKGETKKNGM